MKKAIVLVNLGTPDSPDPKDVGNYLTEFLTDKYVIDLPYPIRQFLVRALIVPKRKFASSEKYKKIWTDKGSPLFLHTESLSKKLDLKLPDHDVFFAMRYGTPSIKSTLGKLKNYDEITVLPLYPQDTKSSFTTAKEAIIKSSPRGVKLKIIPPFYKEDFYIDSLTRKIKSECAEKKIEFYLFSYHGIPQHHLPKSCNDCTGECSNLEMLDSCYRAQCFHTTELIAKKLGLSKEMYSTSFQSRLGRRPWIKPYTDKVIFEIKERGINNMAVLSPSFMSDCLETLEELAIDLKSTFENTGANSNLTFIPCLNDDDNLTKKLSVFLSTNIG